MNSVSLKRNGALTINGTEIKNPTGLRVFKSGIDVNEVTVFVSFNAGWVDVEIGEGNSTLRDMLYSSLEND